MALCHVIKTTIIEWSDSYEQVNREHNANIEVDGKQKIQMNPELITTNITSLHMQTYLF